MIMITNYPTLCPFAVFLLSYNRIPLNLIENKFWKTSRQRFFKKKIYYFLVADLGAYLSPQMVLTIYFPKDLISVAIISKQIKILNFKTLISYFSCCS